ncbi:MAG: 2-oxo-4-hydroxy-4-carboxy-5-ureidoimidazoline decarboxylase [Candidatus Sulfotelmatobacter sp.]
MRSDPSEYQLVAPGSLHAAVSLLAAEPGAWLPIAGGTDVMVQYAAGKLSARRLLSIWNFPELRQVEVLPSEIRIGAGCTYTDLREHEVVRRELPLLASAARWTGGIANQNRGTLGGNIVNASPAADSLPALLAYDAELILVSARGERRLPYLSFHTGYKKTQLLPDELIRAVCLPRKFSSYVTYARKVGARNAQAISKVCIAALGRLAGEMVEDVRIAVGSLAPIPLRLVETEKTVQGKVINPGLLTLAKQTAAREISPIDDIRSTARYRATVAGNLIVEFLEQLHAAGGPANERGASSVNAVLTRWNQLPRREAENEILPCCGSTAWAAGIANRRPLPNEAALLAAADEIWRSLNETDWLQAFRSHPRIGESVTHASTVQSAAWPEQEQQKVADAVDAVKIALAEGNREYERRFTHIFIVCATGKTAPEILAILRRRLDNDAAMELREAAEQQRLITQIRLKKWLSQ